MQAIFTGVINPVTTPGKIGQRYLNTVSGKWFTAKGVASSADWVQDNLAFVDVVYTTTTLTVTPPSGAAMALIRAIGGGGGGGSGRKGAAASNRNGGWGGSAGTVDEVLVPLNGVTTLDFVVGAGGALVNGVTADSTNGTIGNDGGDSYVADQSGHVLANAQGGTPGKAGTTSTSATHAASTTWSGSRKPPKYANMIGFRNAAAALDMSTASALEGGVAGSGAVAASDSALPSGRILPGGGGAGKALNTSNALGNTAVTCQGRQGGTDYSTMSLPADTSTEGQAGANGTARTVTSVADCFGANGAQGGHFSHAVLNTSAGNGGTGGAPGGGGGGGGAMTNGGTGASGAGGAGGAGLIAVRYFIQ